MSFIKQTDKQVEIVDHVLKAADAGAFIDFETLYRSLSYKCSRQALLCSLNILEEAGLVAKQYRYRATMLLKPTLLAYQVYRPSPEMV